MQTEKAKSSHFDRTRGLKNQIFPTKEVHETAPSESPFCQAHNLELLYFCLIAAAAVLGNKKRGKCSPLRSMALPVVEFSRQGYKIGKVFA